MQDSGVAVGGALQVWPLGAVVAKDGQGDVFVLNHIEELQRAGARFFGIVVPGPGLAIGSELALHHDRVDGEQNIAGVRQTHEDGLMAGDVAAGFKQSETR